MEFRVAVLARPAHHCNGRVRIRAQRPDLPLPGFGFTGARTGACKRSVLDHVRPIDSKHDFSIVHVDLHGTSRLEFSEE